MLARQGARPAEEAPTQLHVAIGCSLKLGGSLVEMQQPEVRGEPGGTVVQGWAPSLSQEGHLKARVGGPGFIIRFLPGLELGFARVQGVGGRVCHPNRWLGRIGYQMAAAASRSLGMRLRGPGLHTHKDESRLSLS